MVNLLQSVRGLVALALFVMCASLSFQGFPGALVSLLGALLVLTGYTGSISTMCHTDTYAGKNPWPRFGTICAGFAIASIGAAVINWGGLATINLGSIPVDLKGVSIVGGIIGGLFNIDRPDS